MQNFRYSNLVNSAIQAVLTLRGEAYFVRSIIAVNTLSKDECNVRYASPEHAYNFHIEYCRDDEYAHANVEHYIDVTLNDEHGEFIHSYVLDLDTNTIFDEEGNGQQLES